MLVNERVRAAEISGDLRRARDFLGYEGRGGRVMDRNEKGALQYLGLRAQVPSWIGRVVSDV